MQNFKYQFIINDEPLDEVDEVDEVDVAEVGDVAAVLLPDVVEVVKPQYGELAKAPCDDVL